MPGMHVRSINRIPSTHLDVMQFRTRSEAGVTMTAGWQSNMIKLLKQRTAKRRSGHISTSIDRF